MRLYICTRSAGYDEPEECLVAASSQQEVKKVLDEKYNTDRDRISVESWDIRVQRMPKKPAVIIDAWING